MRCEVDARNRWVLGARAALSEGSIPVIFNRETGKYEDAASVVAVELPPGFEAHVFEEVDGKHVLFMTKTEPPNDEVWLALVRNLTAAQVSIRHGIIGHSLPTEGRLPS